MDIISSNKKTMCTRDISALTDKPHKSVLRVFRDLMEKNLVAQIVPLKFEYKGQFFDYYELCKRDSFVLVARLSPEFTAKLVDRWQELEEKVVESPAWINNLSPAAVIALEDLSGQVTELKSKNLTLTVDKEIITGKLNDLATNLMTGTTIATFAKTLNGLNSNQVQNELVARGYLRRSGGGIEVNSRYRDICFKQGYSEVPSNKKDVGGVEMRKIGKAILLDKGARLIYKFYINKQFVMKKDWDGEFSHNPFESNVVPLSKRIS